MKKTIATKRIKRWQRLDRLLWENILKEPSWNVIAATFVILAFFTAIISLPVALIWRSINRINIRYKKFYPGLFQPV